MIEQKFIYKFSQSNKKKIKINIKLNNKLN